MQSVVRHAGHARIASLVKFFPEAAAFCLVLVFLSSVDISHFGSRK